MKMKSNRDSSRSVGVLRATTPRRWSHIVPVAAASLALGLLPGCRDYFDRKDSISLGIGNAVAENKAVHTIDPWPPGVFKKHQTSDGLRIEKAIDRYRENKPPERSIEQSITRNE